MVRAAKTRAGTPAAGLSPKSAPLSRKDTEHMALRDLIKGLVNESLEEMANSDNDDTNDNGSADEDNTNEGGSNNESDEPDKPNETGTKKGSTLNFSDEDFKKELKTLIKKEVRDVAGDMLNRKPSNNSGNKDVDVDVVFTGLLGFDTQKKG